MVGIVLRQPTVDPERVGLIGRSFRGLLAPRGRSVPWSRPLRLSVCTCRARPANRGRTPPGSSDVNTPDRCFAAGRSERRPTRTSACWPTMPRTRRMGRHRIGDRSDRAMRRSSATPTTCAPRAAQKSAAADCPDGGRENDGSEPLYRHGAAPSAQPNRTMTRSLSVALAVMVLVAVAGCGNHQDQTMPASSVNTASSPSDFEASEPVGYSIIGDVDSLRHPTTSAIFRSCFATPTIDAAGSESWRRWRRWRRCSTSSSSSGETR